VSGKCSSNLGIVARKLPQQLNLRNVNHGPGILMPRVRLAMFDTNLERTATTPYATPRTGTSRTCLYTIW
jgi:hypothetical protein